MVDRFRSGRGIKLSQRDALVPPSNILKVRLYVLTRFKSIVTVKTVAGKNAVNGVQTIWFKIDLGEAFPLFKIVTSDPRRQNLLEALDHPLHILSEPG